MLSDTDIMQQVFAAFQAEQQEHRQAIGELLLDLEREPDHPDRRAILDQLFREAHSLKGGARAAGLLAVEQIAHRIEDLFSALRQASLTLTAELCDPIYQALDAIGALCAQAAPGQDPDLRPYLGLLETLAAPTKALTAAPSAPPLALAPVIEANPLPEPRAAPNHSANETVRLSIAVLDGLMNEAGELMTCALRARDMARDLQAIQQSSAGWQRTWRRIAPLLARAQANRPSLAPIVHHLETWSNGVATLPVDPAKPSASSTEQTPLVDALEQANTLIAQLNQRLIEATRQATADQTRLAVVADRLHAQIRRTRMLPLATLIGPLRLQVREMARTANKLIDFTFDDHEAEADRQVLEQLREVFLHLMRNAIDHGIEAPEERHAANKSPIATLTLSALVNGDRLVIRFADDGAGLDLGAIGQRAVAAGLIAAPDLERTAAADLAEMIFLPGFSTRQTVSAFSGRGVGLDVVRSRVERMHGRVTVESTLGQGTCFVIDVPLSLASSQCLLIQASGSEYVLPLDAVQRILMTNADEFQLVEGRPVLRIEQRAVPVAALSALLGMANGPATHTSRPLALLLGSGERQVACLVDAILGEQELVMHRLPMPLQRVQFLAGAAILANGQVVPMLDAVDLVRAAAGITQHPLPMAAATPSRPHHTPIILVADDSITTRTLEKNILEAAGYRVLLATDGQEAFDRLRQQMEQGGCDLLISDIDMPRLNGFDLTSQIRNDQALRNLPVVLVTSLESPADRERGLQVGADAYIVKRAFDQQLLLETIAKLL